MLDRALELLRDRERDADDGQQDREDDEQGRERRRGAGVAGPGGQAPMGGIEDDHQHDRPHQHADERLEHEPAQVGRDREDHEEAEAAARQAFGHERP